MAHASDTVESSFGRDAEEGIYRAPTRDPCEREYKAQGSPLDFEQQAEQNDEHTARKPHKLVHFSEIAFHDVFLPIVDSVSHIG